MSIQAENTKRVFGLLIAIDHYDKPGANLGGCVSDSLAVEKYLRENTVNAKEKLHLLKLRSPLDSQKDKMTVEGPIPASEALGQPTRKAVIEAFTGFLSQAKEGDVVFVHYSGHGSFETRPKELWHLDAEESSEHRAETMMCKDSYTSQEGKYVPALRDKEIRWLIAQVAKQNPHIVLVMDCCNSSGNTRFKEEGSQARFNEPAVEEDQNGISSYVFYQKDPQARSLLDNDPTAFQIPEGRHLALYACHSYQLAKETKFKEGRFGAFTYYLLQTLRATKGNISYRDLIKLVRAKVAQKVDHQSPQWHCPNLVDTDKIFMGGAATSISGAYTLRPNENNGEGILDAGSLHGLVGPAEGATYFMVFDANKEIGEVDAKTARRAKLAALSAEKSTLTFMDGKPFPADTEILKAFLTASPVTKIKVCIELEIEEKLVEFSSITDANLKDRFVTAKQTLEALLSTNPHVEMVAKDSGKWQYRIFIYTFEGSEKVRITEKDKVAALIAPKITWAKSTLQTVVDEMTHIAKWNRTLTLHNPQNTIIKPGEVTLEAIDEKGEVVAHNGEITLTATPKDVPNPKLKFKAVLHNLDQVPLYCALLHIRPDFAVNPNLLPFDTHLGKIEFVDDLRIKHEQMEVYAGSHTSKSGRTFPTGRFLQFSLPESTGDLEFNEVTEHFKLIVSTEEFDPMHLMQSNLQRSSTTRAGRKKKTKMDHLLNEVQEMGATWADENEKPIEKITDWYATTITVKTKKTPS